MSMTSLHRVQNEPTPRRVRVVTAASLFDGHDAAINIIRRLLQDQGAEVVHLGHDRSVGEIVDAAIQEDADAVAISSYQGGHMEYFGYLVDELRRRGAPSIRVYGGGGGTITPSEIEALHTRGVARIFSPGDGQQLGLAGMIDVIMQECQCAVRESDPVNTQNLDVQNTHEVARWISRVEDAHAAVESGEAEEESLRLLRSAIESGQDARNMPVIGLTGTGGAGKSSVLDELLRRMRRDAPDAAIALLLVDPSRRRSGGALLGDRIRLNAAGGDRCFVRSMATRGSHRALSHSVADALRVLRAAKFDWVVVETAGIGQSDSEIVDLVDASVYVMTPEYGAPSQLEKIDMIDLADIVALNKSDRRGAEDALRDVRRQWKRNHDQRDIPDSEIPVYATIASQWNDAGTESLYGAVRNLLEGFGCNAFRNDTAPLFEPAEGDGEKLSRASNRVLRDVTDAVREYRSETVRIRERAATADGISRALRDLGEESPEFARALPADPEADSSELRAVLRARYNAALEAMPENVREDLANWPADCARYATDEQVTVTRGRSSTTSNWETSLSGSRIPRVALPRTQDWGELVEFLRAENLPGRFPFSAGVFPFRREDEDPTRMFAGEGTPERTNRRFHFLCEGQSAARLSTAFDSVTLYGRNPEARPDILGKVGNSGVSICTVDDAKKLYSGIDLCDPQTSVSLTINGPAPVILAFFLNAAIDQQVEKYLQERGELAAVRARFDHPPLPEYGAERPSTHDGLGLGLLGIPGNRAVEPDVYAKIRADALRKVRGTVQADILKEDQAQNTCILSTEFSLKLMADMQEHFIANEVRNFYSVSVSGYHMAEAGANPITQLAFTLANGFTLVEYYRERGMEVDAFAPNFSYFFSNGLDIEYNVIGRVARRIWAIAMRDRYGASERSQKLKYHIQTSGRSLHAQEMAFNDIRTTLQALTALQDSCNSLHTNAFDEAVTTPTEQSVRRAVAIQLIIQRELGTMKNQNSIQGSYLVDALTDLVEEAVLVEFDRLADRGGVLGAMETRYQRGKIQEESLRYESAKHDGSLPIIGVNTFTAPEEADGHPNESDLMRSSDDEKTAQLRNLDAFQSRWKGECTQALHKLQQVASSGGNVFEELLETVNVASLGEITESLFEVGGRYRRNM